ncbi:uncharacterized protein FIBRA_01622 [Fibroporia radiculosa]|uniref:Cytochrome P450 n=1 Tax=Fibroporia radiculosa TaxID=599839 RepID=J4H1B4_9APHY|nr:uncharacterized protein FIBRA_01622 [Fibroporia radiculosa]CCL99604.1 predicted protein [Fibroporia radiculosa]
MYPIVGLLVLLSACMSETAAVSVICIIPSAICSLWITWHLTSKEDGNAPVTLPECPLTTVLPFFYKRFDFIRRGLELTGQSVYTFKLISTSVVVVSGAAARHDFFLSRELDLHSGFKILSGAIPLLPGVTVDLASRRISLIYKRLAMAQNSDRLERLIPTILQDLQHNIKLWGHSGILSPFDLIPQLTFHANVRSLASAEMADDPDLVVRLKSLYDTLDAAMTPAAVMFPWFPSPSAIRRIIATKKIYSIICAAIDARRDGKTTRDDTLQLLLDNGDDKLVIVGFIMGLLVAGARSTGTTASWLMTFLSGHPHWKERATAELRQLISDHAHICAPSPDVDALDELSASLSTVPLDAWESETPVLDALIRETLRLAQPHTAMRMNTGPEIYLAGKTVPPGTFVVYPFSDAHLSPELYPDPWKFDPARPESKMPFSYVGWGAGKTVCLGQRLAKLQLKLVIAVLTLGFDLTAVDSTGHQLSSLPRPDWNDSLHCKPTGTLCYIRYKLAC